MTNENKTKEYNFGLLERPGQFSEYVLPPATAGTLGGVRIGTGINVQTDGTISVIIPKTPIASENAPGIVKIGTGIDVSLDGTISAKIPDIQKASKDVAGIVQIGNGINVANGVISVEIDTNTIATKTYVTEQIQASITNVLNASYSKGGAK